jgi:hypothetical protein
MAVVVVGVVERTGVELWWISLTSHPPTPARPSTNLHTSYYLLPPTEYCYVSPPDTAASHRLPTSVVPRRYGDTQPLFAPHIPASTPPPPESQTSPVETFFQPQSIGSLMFPSKHRIASYKDSPPNLSSAMSLSTRSELLPSLNTTTTTSYSHSHPLKQNTIYSLPSPDRQPTHSSSSNLPSDQPR